MLSILPNSLTFYAFFISLITPRTKNDTKKKNKLKPAILVTNCSLLRMVTELFLRKQSLCYSMNSLFSNLSRKYYCDANIVATKGVNFESVHFDP